jgi:hypothetical protein
MSVKFANPTLRKLVDKLRKKNKDTLSAFITQAALELVRAVERKKLSKKHYLPFYNEVTVVAEKPGSRTHILMATEDAARVEKAAAQVLHTPLNFLSWAVLLEVRRLAKDEYERRHKAGIKLVKATITGVDETSETLIPVTLKLSGEVGRIIEHVTDSIEVEGKWAARKGEAVDDIVEYFGRKMQKGNLSDLILSYASDLDKVKHNLTKGKRMVNFFVLPITKKAINMYSRKLNHTQTQFISWATLAYAEKHGI